MGRADREGSTRRLLSVAEMMLIDKQLDDLCIKYGGPLILLGVARWRLAVN